MFLGTEFWISAHLVSEISRFENPDTRADVKAPSPALKSSVGRRQLVNSSA